MDKIFSFQNSCGRYFYYDQYILQRLALKMSPNLLKLDKQKREKHKK